MKNIKLFPFILFFSAFLLLAGCASRSYQSNAIHDSIVSELLPLAPKSKEMMAEKGKMVYEQYCGKKMEDHSHYNGCLALKELIVYGYGQDGNVKALPFIRGLDADAENLNDLRYGDCSSYLCVHAGRLPWEIANTYPPGSQTAIDMAGKSFEEYSGYLAAANIGVKYKIPHTLKYVYYYYLGKFNLYQMPSPALLNEFSYKAGEVGGSAYKVGVERFVDDIWKKMVVAESKIVNATASNSDIHSLSEERYKYRAALYDNAISSLSKRSDIEGSQYFLEFLKERRKMVINFVKNN